MALPLAVLIPSITGAVVALVGQDVYEVIKERLAKKMRELGPDILQSAVDKLGIELDASGGISDETLTAAINQSLLAGSGIQLDSVLDRKKMLAGFKGIALRKITEELGLPPAESPYAIKEGLKSWITAEMVQQIAAESGEIVDGARELLELKKKIDGSREVGNWNTPVDFSEAGVSNRARQAKYRRSHKKHWVVR